MFIPKDTYYTPADILIKMGYNPNSRMILYRLIKKGTIKPYYIGRLLTFRESENKQLFRS